MTNLWDRVKVQLQHLPEDRTVVFTSGCFDLLHPGHVWLLEQASRLGDHLVVGVNSDTSVEHLKGQRPVQSQQDRVTMLKALRSVDQVVPFGESRPEELIAHLAAHLDVLVKGWDQDAEPGRSYVEGHGGVVVRLMQGPNMSTTQLRGRVYSEG